MRTSETRERKSGGASAKEEKRAAVDNAIVRCTLPRKQRTSEGTNERTGVGLKESTARSGRLVHFEWPLNLSERRKRFVVVALFCLFCAVTVHGPFFASFFQLKSGQPGQGRNGLQLLGYLRWSPSGFFFWAIS